MTDDIAISVRNLTKKYRIFGHSGERLKQALTFGQVRFHREFTALQDVFSGVKKRSCWHHRLQRIWQKHLVATDLRQLQAGFWHATVRWASFLIAQIIHLLQPRNFPDTHCSRAL